MVGRCIHGRVRREEGGQERVIFQKRLRKFHGEPESNTSGFLPMEPTWVISKLDESSSARNPIFQPQRPHGRNWMKR